MTDPVEEFIVESLENLDQYDAGLLILEKNPSCAKTIASIFRTLHTIKGTCGFLGFPKLESLAHSGENLLSLIRDETLPFNQSIASALLATGDAIRLILEQIEISKTEGDFDHGKLIELLGKFQNASDDPKEPKKEAAQAPLSADTPRPQSSSDTEPVTDESHPLKGSHSSKALENSIRVQVETLDSLMNLVGELVLTRNQIVQIATENASAEMQTAVHRFSQLTSDLQDGMMKTRVQPIDVIWSKLPRTLRDLAELTQKKVRLVTEGAETEMDRTVMEAVKEPLVHLLRNSVDHGIESPERRLAAGKSEEGTIFLRAFHAAGLVTLEISDDGAGINPERIKMKALEKNLISLDLAQRMSESELIRLIFLPGFSTAEEVSTISGRGVGLDVVKIEIEKIGGVVELSSEMGKGTTFRIKIPLTLAILPAVIVGCCGERFAIPQKNLVEVLELNKSLPVQSIQNALMVRLRGTFLPVVRLRSALQIQRKKAFPQRHLVVLKAGSSHFGMVVDSILGAQEIVVKPLTRSLMSLNCFAGSTILGDGQVTLILDIFGIGSRAKVLSVEETIVAHSDSEEPDLENSNLPEKTKLLVFRVGGTRAAIPLEWVHRLEEFPINSIEQCAGRKVVQYGGEILPLLPIAKAINLPETSADPAMVQTVIYRYHQQQVGLVIEAVEIITHASIELKIAGKRPGVLGSAIVQDRVTELVDIPGILRTHAPEFFQTAS